jgi:hypothetical protein
LNAGLLREDFRWSSECLLHNTRRCRASEQEGVRDRRFETMQRFQRTFHIRLIQRFYSQRGRKTSESSPIVRRILGTLDCERLDLLGKGGPEAAPVVLRFASEVRLHRVLAVVECIGCHPCQLIELILPGRASSIALHLCTVHALRASSRRDSQGSCLNM